MIDCSRINHVLKGFGNQEVLEIVMIEKNILEATTISKTFFDHLGSNPAVTFLYIEEIKLYMKHDVKLS